MAAVFSNWLCSHNNKPKLLKIVHPGGHIELHDGPVLAAEIIHRNPSCFLSITDQSPEIVAADTMLLLGRKYYLVPARSIRILEENQALAMEDEKGKFGSGNCIMCLIDGMKIGKEKGKSEKRRRRRKRGIFVENGYIRRGSPKRQFESNSDNWEPSLDSITEE